MHPGEQSLELTIAQHYTWIGLKPTCVRVCKNWENCAVSKKRDQKKGLLPPKPNPEIIPWHTLCIDLAGPYKCGDEKKPETYIELHCTTMIDPATGFFEIVEVGQKESCGFPSVAFPYPCLSLAGGLDRPAVSFSSCWLIVGWLELESRRNQMSPGSPIGAHQCLLNGMLNE